MKKPPHELLLDALRVLPAVDGKNILARCGDREIALSTLYMDLHQRSWYFSFLPPAKAARVQEELILQRRLHIKYDYYLQAVQRIRAAISGRGPSRGFGSYLRPRKER